MDNENSDFITTFNFNVDYFTEKEIDEEKLKHMDYVKENRAKQLLEFKKERRLKTKEKRKTDKKNLLNSMTKEERKSFNINLDNNKRLAEDNLKKGLLSDYKILFDLDYLNLMTSVEIKSLASQLTYCYSLNKKLKTPFCYYFSSYKDQAKVQMEAMGSFKWYGKFFEEKFSEIDEVVNSGKEIIYLSPDSSEILSEVNTNSIYIIGGFVDKPVSRFRSLYKASGLNIKTARLPLDDCLKDISNKVLNINNVVEMIGAFIEIGNWEEVIKKYLPGRMLKKC